MRITTPALLAACVVVAACSKPDNKPADATKPATAAAKTTPEAPKDTAGPVVVAPPNTAPAGVGDKLIPAEAALLAHVDVKGLAGSPLWAANKALMDADPEVKKQMDAFTTCNMPFSGFRTIDIGVGGEGKEIALVVNGAGVGKPENLRCLQDKLKDGDWKMEEVDGKTRLVFDNGEAFGHPVDDDTLAIATKAWDAAVLGLVAGTGTSVRDGALKDVLAQADQSKHVWFAGNLPPNLAKLATAAPGMNAMAGLKSVAGSLDLSAGLGLVLAFGMENADKAKSTLAEVQKQFATVKPMAGMFGIPATAVDKVAFETKDAAVTMTASLTMDEINALSGALNQAAGGKPMPMTGPAGIVTNDVPHPDAKPDAKMDAKTDAKDSTKAGTKDSTKVDAKDSKPDAKPAKADAAKADPTK
jgi:hypothetical protein